VKYRDLDAEELTSRAFRKFVTSYRRLCPRRKYDIGSKAT
jgi:hypothetical protein